MHIGLQLRRVLAGLAACLAVIGSVAVAASPAVADLPYEVSVDELEVICVAFDGSLTEDRHNYRCVLTDAEILCEAVTQSCVYLTEVEMPDPFEGACVRIVEGEFIIVAPAIYACQFELGTVMVACPAIPDDKAPPCVVGWVMPSEVPVK